MSIWHEINHAMGGEGGVPCDIFTIVHQPIFWLGFSHQTGEQRCLEKTRR